MSKKNTKEKLRDQDLHPDLQGEVVESTAEVIEEETPEQAALDEIIMLQNELAETQTKANEYLDGWQRSRAEFMNYKKRVEREQNETYQRAAGNIIKRYLDVLDDLDMAIRNRPVQGDDKVWANGIELIYRKLLNILENEGVTRMKVDGEPFDPNYHEAISMEPSDTVPSGHVTEVLKQGYLIGDRVLRPALVRVAQ
jgi:molecular chaperone GrpE